MVIANTFRQKLIAGKPTIGTHFMFNDPDIREMIGDSGFLVTANLRQNMRALIWIGSTTSLDQLNAGDCL